MEEQRDELRKKYDEQKSAHSNETKTWQLERLKLNSQLDKVSILDYENNEPTLLSL